MSYMREHFETIETLFRLSRPSGNNVYSRFMLTHGRDYQIGPDTYKGRRGARKQCFMNAAKLALRNSKLTYVEGKVACYGLPIDHAWCVTDDGFVVDPTVRNGDDGHISDYFGVPFHVSYLAAAIRENNSYGLLDYFYANKTAPKLYELGLEKGQRWLMGVL
jgi:hypothetical protein